MLTTPKQYYSVWLFLSILSIIVREKGCCIGFISSKYTIPQQQQFASRTAISFVNYHHHHQRSFTLPSSVLNQQQSNNAETNEQKQPIATIVGYLSNEEENDLKRILIRTGYQYITYSSLEKDIKVYSYKYVKASGMLKLMEDGINSNEDTGAPKWIPVQSGEENLLVANGWSFLDPDESEPMSSFDIDAANEEGQYKPKWGDEDSSTTNTNNAYLLSSLGFDMKPMSREEILADVDEFLSQTTTSSRSVLLEGATDEPNIKITNNGFNFSGSVKEGDIEKGLFVCAIGGLPLFTTDDLSPTTASSGWMTFSRPVADDHIKFVHPEKDANDQRIEVICARTGCHLGHYFGKGEGYCINTSALNFIPYNRALANEWNDRTNPISWRKLVTSEGELPPTEITMRQSILNNIAMKKVSLGAGCFWHVEFALRRLPGLIDTAVGYSGGVTTSPSYKDVCSGNTNHAEVVICTFDPKVLDPSKLFDCFLAMHDPTSVRSHGKRAQKTGQYRSCIFVYDEEMKSIAKSSVIECRKQISKLLSTEIELLSESLFWLAEDRHQRHDERVKDKSEEDMMTLSLSQWLLQYGRRSASIWGSSETIVVDSDGDDGMARMMI